MTGQLLAAALFGWCAAAAVALVARRRLVLAARACHEVRGPLTASFLALEMMVRSGAAPQEEAAGLDAQLRRARMAVDDLALAPLGRRAAERAEPVGTVALLAALDLAWAPVAAARGRDLRVETPPSACVLADRVRLSQAVGNLVANAIDHGRGNILVRARVGVESVRIEVHDEGAGLPEPLAVLLRRARRRRGRRGHGLAVAADVAARAGGCLACGPSPLGAAMVVELPRWRGSAVAA